MSTVPVFVELVTASAGEHFTQIDDNDDFKVVQSSTSDTV